MILEAIRLVFAGKAGLLTITAGVAMGGCTNAVTLPRHLAQPADASVRVPPPAYSSVTGQTQSYRPVGPRDWEDLNRRVGPKQ